jgi:DNA invertase Pin-like site-specific DNA recombinase
MRLARLCRTVPLLTQLSDVLVQHSAQVYAVREPQEPMPPEKVRRRRGLRGVLDYFAMALSEEEQQVRVERMRQGMTRRIKAGLPAHSRKGHYGYIAPAQSSEVPTPDPVEAPWLKWVFDQRCRGGSYERIADYLNDHGVKSPTGGRWHGSEIYYLVHNPIYCGIVKWGDLSNDNGQHEALVDYDTWIRAQRVGTSPTKREPHILTGLVYCALCGHRMVYVLWRHGHGTNKRASLRCSNYNRSHANHCVSNGMPAAYVEAEVLRVVREVLADPARYAEYTAPVDGTAAERELLERNLARIAAERERWSRAYGAEAIDLAEFAERRRALDRQAEAIAAEIAARERRAASRAHGEDRLRGLAERLDALDEYTAPELNALLRLIVDRVECRQGAQPVVTLL